MLRKILLSSSLLTLFAGCGGLQPDTVWSVSSIDGAIPASCYVDGKPPTKMTTTMGVESNVGPWEMYEGPEGKMFLILADKKTVAEGTKGDSYTFQWSTTVTNSTNPPVSTTTTDSVTNTVSFKVSGDTFTGTWENKQVHTCSGSSCTTTLPNCTVTNQIKGRRIDVDRYRVY
jgi:hypothetical protein